MSISNTHTLLKNIYLKMGERERIDVLEASSYTTSPEGIPKEDFFLEKELDLDHWSWTEDLQEAITEKINGGDLVYLLVYIMMGLSGKNFYLSNYKYICIVYENAKEKECILKIKNSSEVYGDMVYVFDIGLFEAELIGHQHIKNIKESKDSLVICAALLITIVITFYAILFNISHPTLEIPEDLYL